jgi:hypothetical protein
MIECGSDGLLVVQLLLLLLLLLLAEVCLTALLACCAEASLTSHLASVRLELAKQLTAEDIRGRSGLAARERMARRVRRREIGLVVHGLLLLMHG